MAWNQQGGGGPWGSGGGGGGGPWGGGGGGGNGPNWGGGGRGNPPPDIEEMLRKIQDRSKRFMPGGFGTGKGIALLVVAVAIAWGLTGFYRVQPDQQGVEMLFGRYVKTTAPGLNYWFPAPIGGVETPTVTRTNQISVGFRGDARGSDRDVPQESLMLTGDQNIIDADFIVQWRIADAGAYLFNIRDVEDTVKLAAESAMREVIGQVDLEYAMTQGRNMVATRARDLLQQMMDSYGAGVSVLDLKLQQADPPKEVIDAFQDVQRARQDRERLQNEAFAYRNDILPRAQGQAERIVQAANAYREQMVKSAEGEASRFVSVYETYRTAQDVTAQRLYLEAIRDVLKNSEKVLIDEGANGNGVVPYLPLPEIKKRATTAPTGNTQREAGR